MADKKKSATAVDAKKQKAGVAAIEETGKGSSRYDENFYYFSNINHIKCHVLMVVIIPIFNQTFLDVRF